jgi:epoxyqueuosine reductase
MGKSKTDSKISRRNFLKITGAAGIAAQVATVPVMGYKEGKNTDTYLGWESFEGDTQYFDRKPFEMELNKLYSEYTPKVGKTSRPDKLTDIAWTRVARLGGELKKNPDWKPKDGMNSLNLPPDLKEWYADWQQKGQNRFETDVVTATVGIPDWIVNNKKFGPHFALTNAYFNAWADIWDDIYPSEPTAPPEVSDFEVSTHGHKMDIRDMNKQRKEHSALMSFKTPQHASKLIKKISHQFGATVVGIAKLNPDFVYKGGVRGVEGNDPFEVPKHWTHVVVVGVPHEWDQLGGNPQYGGSYDAYARARMAASRLSIFLKQLGYPARHHVPPFHYDLILPPIAVEAGLGTLGRNACMITPEAGPNMRLAAVTTNLDMEVDKPIDFGAEHFCQDCKICAEMCPSQAISMADSTKGMELRGYQHWYMDTSKCYNYWMEAMEPLGCRLCITNCVYSRKNNWVHGVGRVADPVDPTGAVSKTLLWMQKSFFELPEAKKFRKPPDGCFASYRQPPEWLRTEAWFSAKTINPQLMCKKN